MKPEAALTCKTFRFRMPLPNLAYPQRKLRYLATLRQRPTFVRHGCCCPYCWQMSVLELELVSPKLLESRGLSLAVPGTYRVDGSCVRIHQFLQNVVVRKITAQNK